MRKHFIGILKHMFCTVVINCKKTRKRIKIVELQKILTKYKNFQKNQQFIDKWLENVLK